VKYRIEITGEPSVSFYLTQDQFDELSLALALHIDNGFRDGETRTDLVRITELGVATQS
jgi:hypothetical protein